MKCVRGIPLVYDEDLKTMIPFFVRVRSHDIICDAELDITEVMKYTSSRWEIDRVENGVDLTYYKFIGDWDSKYDRNNETVGTSFCRAELGYYIYKDGRLKIHADLRLNADTVTKIGSSNSTFHAEYPVYLPVAFAEDTPKIQVGYAYGTASELTIVAEICKDTITNYSINEGYEDTNLYPFKLVIHVIKSQVDAPALNTIKGIVDSTYASSLTVDDYIKTCFPFTIEYNGWWRPVPPIEIAVPESFDNDISGNYTTIGMVNLLSKPDNTFGEIIRPLKTGTPVKCNGYYTRVEEVNWYLVTFVAANENGYIPENMLE